ncbi:MAG TPA: DUF4136 domain-containing protein [Polyangiaceae bacterium]|nr:DUF4136 domain-containing protein [Polyangiaceae bacterium]
MKARKSRGLEVGVTAALIALAALLGCAAPAAFADWERGVDLSPGKTFALTKSAELPRDLDERQQALVALVNATIERELTRKGYTKAPLESAQLVVNFYVVRRMLEEVSVQSRDCYMSGRGELPPGTNWDSAAIACEESLVSEYQEGTLIIDVYDAARRELVWHGWKSRKSLPSDSPELPTVVEQATIDILSNFPPDPGD